MHKTQAVTRHAFSRHCYDKGHSRQSDLTVLRCNARKEAVEINRRAALVSGGLMLSSIVLPDPSFSESFDFVILPEKLSSGQVTVQRDAVRIRAQKRLNKILTAEDAPLAMRLVFNDAGTYDYPTKTGGLDGSIVLDEELGRPENTMLKPLVTKLKDVKTEVDEENLKNDQSAISWADMIVLAAKTAVSKEWIKERRKKTTSDADAAFVSQTFGAAWPVRVGRVDSNTPGAPGRIPQADASVEDIKTYLLSLGAKPDGGFAYKPPFYERPGYVVYTAAQLDPPASEAYLSTDPAFAVWKKEYDNSKKTITRTNYEVDFITYFTRLTSLGAKFDPLAYLKPVVVKSKK